jgi:hypothetical protein
VQQLVKAERASTQAALRRGAHPPGSSHARLTTLNADWTRKAEHRDRCQEAVVRAALAANLIQAPATLPDGG